MCRRAGAAHPERYQTRTDIFRGVCSRLAASVMSLGFSFGAALGSLTVGIASVRDLGWTAACEAAALILTVFWYGCRAGCRYCLRTSYCSGFWSF